MTRQTKISDLFPRKIFLLIILTIINYHCVAQRYKVTQYAEADGLGNSSTYDISQDSIGKMWFATRAGISSYDGSTWENFNANDGLHGRGSAFVEVDEKGIIWALSLRSPFYLTAFNGDRWEIIFPIKRTEELSLYRSLSVHYENNKPVVLIGTKDKGVLVNRHGKWTNYTESNGLLSDIITATCFVQDSIFVASSRGINIIFNNRISILDKQKLGFPDNNIIGMCSQRITDDDQDKYIVWIAGKDWLGYISEQEFILVSSDINITVDKQYNSIYLLPDQDYGIYIYNEFSVTYFDLDTKESNSLGLKNGLISEGAISIFIDRERNTWIAGGRGVNKIQSKRFANYYKENGLSDNEVTSVEEISPGKYVFGHIGALTFYENGVFNKLELTSPSSNWHEKRVMDISIGNDHNIWIAVGSLGVGCIDINKKIKWFGEKEGLLGRITSVISTSSGKIYASSFKGFFVLSENKFELVKTEGLGDPKIRKIFETKDGSLYCARYNDGIYKLKNGMLESIKYDGEKAFNSTYSVWESPEGDILVGTLGGLLKIQDSVLVKFNDIPLERPVYLIINDHKGQIWFGSDNGIYRWDGNDLEHFSVNEGLAGHEINRDAGLLDSNNNLWFGTNNGVSLYKGKYDYSDDPEIPAPNIVLSFIEIEGDTLSFNEKITLDYNKNDLAFHFKGISFIDENQIYYKCKLEGFDKDWTPEFRSLRNSYRYLNLKPGRYRFCVKARNALGVWSEPLCSNVIIIKPPFWFQWWFMTIAAVFILLIISAILRFISQKQYASKLKKTVQIRTKELKEAKNKAEESDRLKSTFLASMSHELRTPLNAIIGFSDIIDDKVSKKQAQLYAKTINKSGNQLLGIVEDLFDITLIEAGQTKVIIDFVNIDRVFLELGEVMKVEQTLLKKEGVNISIIEPQKPISGDIKTDYIKLKQILINLLKNALKFTEKGSIKYGYNISLNNEIEELEFFVEDTGIGIPIEKRSVIFENFKQVTESHAKLYGGTGLGLAISKKLVELLGGRIWIDSAKRKGTKFYFTIPFIKMPELKSSTQELALVKEKGDRITKFNILIAEDEESSSEYLNVLLKQMGFESFLARDGFEVVEFIKSERDVDLILMDINMPGLSGFEATKIIKEMKPTIPIIAQTAYAISGDREKALEAGCDDYIAKPIRKDELKEKLQKFLN